MATLHSLGLRYDRHGGRATLHILDQTLLPDQEQWLDGADPARMVEHIGLLRVRGAPMIGICAALCLAVEAHRRASPERLRESALALRAARPTAVNLMEAVDRLLPLCTTPDALVDAAEALFDEEVSRSDGMAERGASLVQPGEGILTHCNTGGLATAGTGTALAVIRRAHEQGKGVHAWVDETRPLLQGGRLTAWELGRLGVPYHLLPDGAAGLLFARGRVQRVLVGADRIARNGDFANKIGTFALAVLARHHGVPFHVVAPRTTIDRACPDGAAIPIEERPADEVRGLVGRLRWAPADAPVYNPAFDVTPAALVTSWILDDAVLSPAQVAAGALT